MALETGTYLNDLVASNPPGTDNRSQADDHLRLIKSVLKNTWPGLGSRFNLPTAASSTITVTTTDNFKLWYATTAVTAALPAVASVSSGFTVYLYAMSGAVTIDPDGSETVNGAATFVLSVGQWCSVVSTGTAWIAMAGSASADKGFKNLLYNGAFNVNQRGVSGTVVLAAGAFGHDGWFGGASGATYTFATSNGRVTLTISAGSLKRIVPSEDIPGGTNTLVMSWSGTAQGKIGAGSYSASGVTSSVSGGSNLVLEFGTGTLAEVQLEKGAVATDFEQTPMTLELCRCRRFLNMLVTDGASGDIGYGYQSDTTTFSVTSIHEVEMYGVPTFSYTGAASDYGVSLGATTLTVSAIALFDGGKNRTTVNITTSTGTSGYGGHVYTLSASRKWFFSAEITS